MNKFLYLWESGFKANLHVEAQNGQAFVNLRAGLGFLQQAPQKPLSRRQPGPSRVRRRQRRAAARQAAEEAPATEEEVVAEEEGDAAEEAADIIEEILEPSPESLAVEVNENGIEEELTVAGKASLTAQISTAEVVLYPEDSPPLAPQFTRVAEQASPQHQQHLCNRKDVMKPNCRDLKKVLAMDSNQLM